VRQAVRLAPGVPVLFGAWRHGVLRQAVTRKQWVWGRWRLAVSKYRQAVWNSFAWRRVGRARRKRCYSLPFGVSFLTDNDALLGSGGVVP